MEVASEETQEEKEEVTGCMHPWVQLWASCQGCRKTPLSANLPDYHRKR